ncbi:hypothetical protein PQX77_009815 [Marasmius sp. AFHP31]|nr:hypothetical protein PQX77_009815 [Marasmius sp. AFHP31]
MLLPSSLLYFLLAGLVIYSEASSQAPRPLKRLAHPTTHHVDIFPRNSGSKRNLDSDSGSLRFDDAFRLTLSAFEETFHIHLTPNNHLVHPTARITYYDRDPLTGETIQQSVPLLREDVRVYEGYVIHPDHTEGRKLEDIAGVREGFSSYPERGWARVTVFEHEDGESPVYEGAFSVDGVIHHIMTKENYNRVKRPSDPEAEDLDESLVIWRDSDIMSEEEEYFGRTGQPLPPSLHPKPHTCGHDTLEYNVDPTLNSALRTHHDFSLWPALSLWPRQSGGDDAGGGGISSNFADSIGQTAGCPNSQRILYMGVAADCVYVSRYGSTKAASEKILSDWNSASSLYKSSFNVSLGIIELSVQQANCPSQASSDTPWNVDCNTSIDRRLSLFSGWRGNKGDDGAGLWHLMSGCPTGQEVGIAWMATLCRQSSSQNGGQTVSGTGVSTIGMTEWQVVAHEVGHNFGAIHDCTEGCSLSGGCCPLSTSSCDSSSRYIMSPVTREGEFTFSPCSVGNICSLMGGRGSGADINTGCLLDPAQATRPLISMQMCGNGIVEDGEDCDPGTNVTSSCCDTSTCKFINNAKCDPASGTCCTAQCEFMSADTVCRPKKDEACDEEERSMSNGGSVDGTESCMSAVAEYVRTYVPESKFDEFVYPTFVLDD